MEKDSNCMQAVVPRLSRKWTRFYGGGIMIIFSNLWKEFTEFQKEQLDIHGYEEGLFSESFQCVAYGDDDKDWLRSYLGAVGATNETLNTLVESLYYIGLATGDGSGYAFLKINEGPIDENPVLLCSTDGYINLVASNFTELLTLLTVDAEPMTGVADELAAYYKDDWEEHSRAYGEFVAWLEARNILVIHGEDEAEVESEEIINNANDKYGKNLLAFMNSL